MLFLYCYQIVSIPKWWCVSACAAVLMEVQELQHKVAVVSGEVGIDVHWVENMSRPCSLWKWYVCSTRLFHTGFLVIRKGTPLAPGGAPLDLVIRRGSDRIYGVVKYQLHLGIPKSMMMNKSQVR